jgi:hypothetical protein
MDRIERTEQHRTNGRRPIRDSLIKLDDFDRGQQGAKAIRIVSVSGGRTASFDDADATGDDSVGLDVPPQHLD